MAQATPNPSRAASLYVGDLAPEVTEATLFELFNAVGPVASTRVCRDRTTRKSLGYAYVNFHSAKDAERALDTMNFTNIKGKPCRIMWTQRDPTLRKSGKGNVFVKNLHESIDNKTLWDTFSVFGQILSCKVVTDPESGTSRGYGYVHYLKNEDADKAIQGVNGMLIQDKKVTAERFRSKKDRMAKTQWTNVYVKYIPDGVTEDELKDLFISTLRNFFIKKRESNPDGATDETAPKPENVEITSSTFKTLSCGNWACLNFKMHEQAVAAVDLLNQYEFPEKKKASEDASKAGDASGAGADGGDGDKAEQKADEEKAADSAIPTEQRKLFVTRAQKRRERDMEIKRGSKFSSRKVYGPEGANLYVKNLAESIDDEGLKAVFEKFGKIISCRVMKDANQKSRGFGFVQFAKADDASKALMEMNMESVEGKAIYVARAQRKSERRNQTRLTSIRGRGRGRGRPRPRMTGPPGPFAAPPGFGPMGHPSMAGFAPMTGRPPFPPAPFGMGQMVPPQFQRPPMMHMYNPAFPTGANPLMQHGGAAFGVGGGRFPPAPSAQMPSNPQHVPQSGRGLISHSNPPTGINTSVPGQSQPARAASSFQSHGAAQSNPQVTTAVAPHAVGPTGGSIPHQSVSSMPASGPVAAGAHMSGTNASQVSAPMREQQPLTPAMLADAKPNERKRLIGERLFPKIQEVEPRLAGKITGMLLEMDNTELLILLENREQLMKKINEALGVLKDHQQRQSAHNRASGQNSATNASGANPASQPQFGPGTGSQPIYSQPQQPTSVGHTGYAPAHRG